MKKYLFLSFLLISIVLNSKEIDVKLVKTIGDEKSENHIFFRISGAIVNPNKEIIVGDSGGNFIAKYSWNGKLLEKNSRKGQGPNDFLDYSDLDYCDSKLYIYDYNNYRIAISDKNLKEFSYIKLMESYQNVIVMDSNNFLMSYINDVGDPYSLKIMDRKGEVKAKFFDFDQFGKLKKTNDLDKIMKRAVLSKVVATYSKDKQKIVVGFRFPKRNSNFYIYSKAGKLIKKISWYDEENKEFPIYKLSLDKKKKISKKIEYTYINKLVCYKGYILAFINNNMSYKGEAQTTKTKLFVFDWEGNLVHRKDFTKKSLSFRSFCDGYITCISENDEDVKLYIYKINIKE